MNIWQGQECYELYPIPSMSWLNISCFPQPDITELSAVLFSRDKFTFMRGCTSWSSNRMFKKHHEKFICIRLCDPPPLSLSHLNLPFSLSFLLTPRLSILKTDFTQKDQAENIFFHSNPRIHTLHRLKVAIVWFLLALEPSSMVCTPG